MGEYLPEVYERFGMEYADVMDAYRTLAERLHEAGPLSARERRLAKLGIAAGRESEGGVRSHARKALAEGINSRPRIAVKAYLDGTRRGRFLNLKQTRSIGSVRSRPRTHYEGREMRSRAATPHLLPISLRGGEGNTVRTTTPQVRQ
jgi:hypothetical protein